MKLTNSLNQLLNEFKPFISTFCNVADEENEFYSNKWEECIGRVYGGILVGAFPKREYKDICMFQFRELTQYTNNYTISYPSKIGYSGDIIIEISYAPHQHWEFYNMNREEDKKKLMEDMKKVGII